MPERHKGVQDMASKLSYDVEAATTNPTQGQFTEMTEEVHRRETSRLKWIVGVVVGILVIVALGVIGGIILEHKLQNGGIVAPAPTGNTTGVPTTSTTGTPTASTTNTPPECEGVAISPSACTNLDVTSSSFGTHMKCCGREWALNKCVARGRLNGEDICTSHDQIHVVCNSHAVSVGWCPNCMDVMASNSSGCSTRGVEDAVFMWWL